MVRAGWQASQHTTALLVGKRNKNDRKSSQKKLILAKQEAKNSLIIPMIPVRHNVSYKALD